jgi:hypothetical protein
LTQYHLRVVATLTFVAALVLHSILKCFSLLPQISDEGDYFYAARLILEGKVPYSDFFLAHPPLPVLFLSLLFAMCGASVTAAKVSLWLLGIAQAGLVFALVRILVAGKVGDEHRNLAAATSASLLLLSSGFLQATSYSTGTVEGTTLALVVPILLLLGKARCAGVLAASCCFISLQVMPLLLAITALQLSGQSKASRFAFSWTLLATFIGACGIFLAWCGPAIFEQAWFFHLMKVPCRGLNWSIPVEVVVRDSATLVVLAFLGSFALVVRRSDLSRTPIGILLALAVQVVAVAGTPCPFADYLISCLPWLAVLTGLGLAAALESLRPRLAFAAPIACIGTLLLQQAQFAGKDDPLSVRPCELTPSPPLGMFNDYVRGVFWTGAPQRLSDRTDDIAGFLGAQCCGFDTLPTVVQRVQELSKKRAGLQLAGEDGITPLVAFITDLGVVENFSDTNPQRFEARPRDFQAFLLAIQRASSPALLIRSGSALALRRETASVIASEFVPDAHFETQCGVRLSLYVRAP